MQMKVQPCRETQQGNDDQFESISTTQTDFVTVRSDNPRLVVRLVIMLISWNWQLYLVGRRSWTQQFWTCDGMAWSYGRNIVWWAMIIEFIISQIISVHVGIWCVICIRAYSNIFGSSSILPHVCLEKCYLMIIKTPRCFMFK